MPPSSAFPLYGIGKNVSSDFKDHSTFLLGISDFFSRLIRTFLLFLGTCYCPCAVLSAEISVASRMCGSFRKQALIRGIRHQEIKLIFSIRGRNKARATTYLKMIDRWKQSDITAGNRRRTAIQRY